MDKEKLKNTASEYMQIWSAENADLLDKCADKNIVADYTHFEKPYKGVQNYKSMLKMTYDFFPDLKITIKNLIPNEVEQIVTVEWKYDGTHTTTVVCMARCVQISDYFRLSHKPDF